MTKDIKGVFQIYLKINDSSEYKYTPRTKFDDIFLGDSNHAEDLRKHKESLIKINNFEILIQEVTLFYINKNQEQDFFAVGYDTEMKENTVFLVWASDTSAEEVIIKEIRLFNSRLKDLLKKAGCHSWDRKCGLEIKGGEEMKIFPANNVGGKSYNNQEIGDYYNCIRWVKLEKETTKSKTKKITKTI